MVVKVASSGGSALEDAMVERRRGYIYRVVDWCESVAFVPVQALQAESVFVIGMATGARLDS